MGSKPWLYPAPTYRKLESFWDTEDDSSGPRCGLAGVTNSVHSYDILTQKWTRIKPAGEPPSPRAAHAAATMGTMVVFQGGIGPAGHSTDYLYVLDLTNDKGPGPRYGHVMDLVAQRYLVTVSGNDGDRPSARMYATASARSDGMLLQCADRDSNGAPLADAYGLLMHRNGQWEWTLAPGVSPSPRCQHAGVFVGARLHVTGGVLKGGRSVEGEAAISVLDTAAGVWLDRNGLVTSSRSSKDHAQFDPDLEMMRRCRHAAASVGVRVYIYGGLRGDALDNFLVTAPFQSDAISPTLAPDRGSPTSNLKVRPSNLVSETSSTSDSESENPTSVGMSMDRNSMEKLRLASAAEAEVAHASGNLSKELRLSLLKKLRHHMTTLKRQKMDQTVVTQRLMFNCIPEQWLLQKRLWVILVEWFGNYLLINLRMRADEWYQQTVISTLLRPRNWKAPVNRRFFLDSYEVGELCYAAEQIFMHEPTVLQLKAPIKVFGDLHGQFDTSTTYFWVIMWTVDSTARRQSRCSFALKIEYPENLHLIWGNHEAADINALFGFCLECVERMGENDGIWAWTRFNQLFNCLPLAALIEKKIICMHGSIGRSINPVEQIEKLERSITMDAGSVILMDLLRSDPTENDSVEGLRPNTRGPGLVTFGLTG
ncbi:hypothetical protein MLD38_031790 [Melastoma candidum]|uniref:Uncharacterized protein n=1 Tax=Melastoma candidum TaxID=119954 RepID=A0ACB9MRX8_9MYRT|nr:hypothetical protein MLD38_031790 [Melastoma candidum]